MQNYLESLPPLLVDFCRYCQILVGRKNFGREEILWHLPGASKATPPSRRSRYVKSILIRSIALRNLLLQDKLLFKLSGR
jgi:hypothetical protein